MSKRTHTSDSDAYISVKREPVSPSANFPNSPPREEAPTQESVPIKRSPSSETLNEEIPNQTDNNNANNTNNDPNGQPESGPSGLYHTYGVPQNLPNDNPDPDEPTYLFTRVPMPAFVPKKTKAYLAYQNKLHYDDMRSEDILLKIVHYLEIQDVLKFRLLNKNWKSIMDRRNRWFSVKLGRGTKIVDWHKFVVKLQKYETYDLIFDRFTPTGPTSSIIEAFYGKRIMRFIRFILIKSVGGVQNKFAIELACAFRPYPPDPVFMPGCIIEWEVKTVDGNMGRPMVPIRCERLPPKIKHRFFHQPNKTLYCYLKLPDMLGNPMEDNFIELNEIEELFNGGDNDIVKVACDALRVEIRDVV